MALSAKVGLPATVPFLSCTPFGGRGTSATGSGIIRRHSLSCCLLEGPSPGSSMGSPLRYSSLRSTFPADSTHYLSYFFSCSFYVDCVPCPASSVRGSSSAVAAIAGATRSVNLTSHEPHLEETFLEYFPPIPGKRAGPRAVLRSVPGSTGWGMVRLRNDGGVLLAVQPCPGRRLRHLPPRRPCAPRRPEPDPSFLASRLPSVLASTFLSTPSFVTCHFLLVLSSSSLFLSSFSLSLFFLTFSVYEDMQARDYWLAVGRGDGAGLASRLGGVAAGLPRRGGGRRRLHAFFVLGRAVRVYQRCGVAGMRSRCLLLALALFALFLRSRSSCRPCAARRWLARPSWSSSIVRRPRPPNPRAPGSRGGRRFRWYGLQHAMGARRPPRRDRRRLEARRSWWGAFGLAALAFSGASTSAAGFSLGRPALPCPSDFRSVLGSFLFLCRASLASRSLSCLFFPLYHTAVMPSSWSRSPALVGHPEITCRACSRCQRARERPVPKGFFFFFIATFLVQHRASCCRPPWRPLWPRGPRRQPGSYAELARRGIALGHRPPSERSGGPRLRAWWSPPCPVVA